MTSGQTCCRAKYLSCCCYHSVAVVITQEVALYCYLKPLTFSLVNQTPVSPHKSETQPCVAILVAPVAVEWISAELTEVLADSNITEMW